MNTTLKAAISLLTLGGASVGGYILANDYNDDAPIYIEKEKASLRDTREIFMPNTLGYKFPSIFLSTRAVKNSTEWDKKKEQVKAGTTWNDGSFFQGITHEDQEIIEKLKLSCLNAYKYVLPTEFSNDNGDFLMSKPKWREVWLMCGVKTTKTPKPTTQASPGTPS